MVKYRRANIPRVVLVRRWHEVTFEHRARWSGLGSAGELAGHVADQDEAQY